MKQSEISESWMVKGRGAWIGAIRLASGERIRVRIVMMLVAFCLLFVGCDKEFARGTRLAAHSAPAPEEVLIICDAGAASTCTESSFAATLDVVLPYAAARPGSRVMLWSVGEQPTDSRLVAEREVSGSKRRGLRAVQAHQRRFVADARSFFVTAAAPLFRDRKRTQTPLFETITAATLQPSSLHRRLFLISDLREQTPRTATTECSPLPNAVRLIERLHQRGILTPGLLRDTTVHLSFVTYTSVEGERCPFDIGRFAQLQSLWRAVLQASGATVEISNGAPNLKE